MNTEDMLTLPSGQDINKARYKQSTFKDLQDDDHLNENHFHDHFHDHFYDNFHEI